MSDLPCPLVPAEVDLRDFATMPLAVQILRDSRFAAEVTPEAFRAGVLLWCAAWHQVPAGSLPDNDAELAKLAGYGFVVKEWRKVKVQALTKFVLCSDGRRYHEEISERAVTAWRSRLEHFYERAKDRLRKANKDRATAKPPLDALPTLTFDQWNERRMAGGIPMEKAEAFESVPSNSASTSAGIPPENALKGEGEGTERERNGEGKSLSSEPIGSGAAAPPPPPPAPPADPGPPPAAVDAIFAVGIPLLTSANVTERNARSFLGYLRKQAKGRGGDEAVARAISACSAEQATSPVEYLQACFVKAPTAAFGAGQPEQDVLEAAVCRRLGVAPEAGHQEVIDG